MRSRPTFSKLQKERARQEKQRSKAERKLQRKLQKQTANDVPEGNDVPESEEGFAAPSDAYADGTE